MAMHVCFVTAYENAPWPTTYPFKSNVVAPYPYNLSAKVLSQFGGVRQPDLQHVSAEIVLSWNLIPFRGQVPSDLYNGLRF